MKKYMGIFLLRVARAEHGRLNDVLRDASGGDFKLAFMAPTKRGQDEGSVVGYLFTLQVPLRSLDFAKILLRGDEYLLVELGEAHRDFGLGIARDWLQKHEAHPDRR